MMDDRSRTSRLSNRLSIVGVWAAVLSACVVWQSQGAAQAAGEPLAIERITPSGEDVPVGREIVLQFNREVVPVGRMERRDAEVPVRIEPPLKCQWRWINRSALACRLSEEEALRPATRYILTVASSFAAQDGATLGAEKSFSFLTLRPRADRADFVGWAGPDRPVLRVAFNQPVSKSSVARSLYFEEKGKPKIRHALRAEADPQDGEGQVIVAGGEESRRVWVVSAVEGLPEDADMALKVAPGLLSAQGPEQGVEDSVLSSFSTFPPFALVGVRCTTGGPEMESLLLSLADLVKGKGITRCDPQRPVGLAFSTPVQTAAFRDAVQVTPALSNTPAFDPWAGRTSERAFTEPHARGVDYTVWLPVWLAAQKEYRFRSAPAAVAGTGDKALTDFFGRPLAAGFDFSMLSGARRPDFLFPHALSVQEAQISGDLPLYVQNLEGVRYAYRTLTPSGLSEDLKGQFSVPDVKNTRFAVPFSVRGLLGGKSGAVRGSLYPQPDFTTQGIPFFAQVTPWAVHAKAGHHNMAVWVADMKTGAPVAGAHVKIFSSAGNSFEAAPAFVREAQTDADGIAMLEGAAALGPAPAGESWHIHVVQGDSMALLPLDWDFNISTYNVSDSTVSSLTLPRYGHLKARGVSAQGVYRVGETIDYKIYVRDQDNFKLVPAPAKGYSLTIVDPTGLVVEERKDLTLNAFGALDGQYTIPEMAKVGWYEFQLSASFLTTGPVEAMRVLVSDFTPALFRVESTLEGERFGPDSPVGVQASATLHSGGAYDNGEIRVSGKILARAFTPDNPAMRGFYFDSFDSEAPDSATVFESIERLDAQGSYAGRFTIPVQDKLVHGRLVVESAVRDDRGAYVSSYASADYAGVGRLVGLRLGQWAMEKDKPFTVESVVSSIEGDFVSGVPIDLTVERSERKVARVRGPGNAYLTETSESWVKTGGCALVSAAKPVKCEITPEISGAYRVVAQVADEQGRTHKNMQSFWVAGPDFVPWQSGNDQTLRIIPQQKQVKVGETARFVIENPYPGAKAFISVERMGVMRHWVKTFATSTQTLELPVLADDVPGFYLSVVLFSPRAAPPPEDRSVDLGKPTFRMGYVSVPVVDPYKRIAVTAAVEHETYQPREKVRLSLRAAPRAESGREPVELAVAVVDEAVLDLIEGGADYYDPYALFYTLDYLDVENYNTLMRLVGRQHIEKKGANAGGDGGASLGLRNLFKFVSYWNPSIPVDARGEATVEFEAPDNLTGWRVLVLAATQGDQMGLGQASFKVNRPTELRSVLPNQILEGDAFTGAFSVLNRTDKARRLTVEMEAQGDLKNGPLHATEVLDVPAFSARIVDFPVESAPIKGGSDTPRGTITFRLRAFDDQDEDGLEQHLDVIKRRTFVTAAEYGTSTDPHVEVPLSVPKAIHPDAGDLSVVLSPSVVGNVAGAFLYMKDYPYSCWEQKISKAVMAAQYDALRAYLPSDLEWKDTKALVEATLREAPGFQASNGGMTYFGGDESFVDPYLSAYTALALFWLQEEGYTVPAAFRTALHGYLKTLLSEDNFPEPYTKAMASSVRAVALAVLAEGGEANREELERYKPALDDMDLFGKAHYLRAALAVPESETYVDAARTKILAASAQTGGKLSFNETIDDSFTRILTSPLRSECAILDALIALPKQSKADQDRLFKMVRAVVQARGKRDHWENTQENLFCMRALAQYARHKEDARPSLEVKASFGTEQIGQARFGSVRDPAKTLTYPLKDSDAGREAPVTIDRTGAGRLYYATSLRYAPTGDAAQGVNAGMEIRRELSVQRDGKWSLVAPDAVLRQGDLLRSDLYISLPAARTFVVVNDPVPGGVEPINRDLATASASDADRAESTMAGGAYWFEVEGWQSYGVSRWSFYHSEIRHDSVRFYSDYLEPGNYHLSWTGRVIAAGTFGALPPRVEEMYDPDVFGTGLPVSLKVEK